MLRYVSFLKAREMAAEAAGQVWQRKQSRMAEHLLKCSPAHVKRWEAKPGRKSLACKMSLQRSVIKQTFDTGFIRGASLLTRFPQCSIHISDLHICLTDMNKDELLPGSPAEKKDDIHKKDKNHKTDGVWSDGAINNYFHHILLYHSHSSDSRQLTTEQHRYLHGEEKSRK